MENINIEEIIYKWFDMKYQTYNKLDRDGSIYLSNEGNEYADIWIDKKSKYIFYEWELYKEFYELIPLEYLEFEKFMDKWVEHTFGLKGFTLTPRFFGIYLG